MKDLQNKQKKNNNYEFFKDTYTQKGFGDFF